MTNDYMHDPPTVDQYDHMYLGKTPLPSLPSRPPSAEDFAPWKRVVIYWNDRDLLRRIILEAKARVEASGVLVVETKDGRTYGFSPVHYRYFTVQPVEGE